MAGAGYKAFADGDVLTAAQVQTFLQDQAVMRFADSSARTSGLGTAVAEGMVSYLQDTDAVEVYDGSAWKGVGGLVATHYVELTTAFTASSIASGASTPVTGLSISSVALADASHKLIITSWFGIAANGGDYGRTGIAVSNGSNLLSVATSPGNRVPVSAGGLVSTANNFAVNNPSITIVYAPGDTTPRTYTTHAINIRSVAADLYINRSEVDTNTADASRSASALLIQEVRV